MSGLRSDELVSCVWYNSCQPGKTRSLGSRLMVAGDSNPYVTVLSITGPSKKNTLKIKLLSYSVCSQTWY